MTSCIGARRFRLYVIRGRPPWRSQRVYSGTGGGDRAKAVVPETVTAAAMAGAGPAPGLPGAGGPVVPGPGAGIPGKSGEERLKEMEAEMAL